jgi:hypothetical protein
VHAAAAMRLWRREAGRARGAHRGAARAGVRRQSACSLRQSRPRRAPPAAPAPAGDPSCRVTAAGNAPAASPWRPTTPTRFGRREGWRPAWRAACLPPRGGRNARVAAGTDACPPSTLDPSLPLLLLHSPGVRPRQGRRRARGHCRQRGGGGRV